MVVEVIVCIVNEVIGCVELIVVIGDTVDEVGLKELMILRSSEITFRPSSRSFLIFPIISVVRFASSSISVQMFVMMS